MDAPRPPGHAVPLILSGGLTPDNVAEAIAAVRPSAVDVASGVERSRAARTTDKLAAFAAAVALDDGRRWPPTEHGRAQVLPLRGQYVPETLMPALTELEQAWLAARADPAFGAELDALLRDYVGRPSPLYLAARLSAAAGHPIYLKREDLNHTGAHKINNALGQALLAKRMGKRRIIAETGAGQHGVAAATACALLDLECVVYMGTEDMRRQRPNVERMGLLGAVVEPVEAGARTLKEAVSAAIRDWVANVATTHYIIGSCVGPAPYPALVRDLQRVIGDEARAQILNHAGRLPQRVIACVGGGSNAIGIFTPFAVRRGGRAARRGGGREGLRHQPSRGAAHRRRTPRACSRQLLGGDAGRGRPDSGGALDLRGPGLSGQRP